MPETKLEAETGAPVQHILMEETRGQDVVLNTLGVFVNRWRHMLAKVTSLSPEKKGRGRGSGGESIKFPIAQRTS